MRSCSRVLECLRVAGERIHSFAGDHPEFQPLREASDADTRAATALVFNHAEHMKAGLKGPNGPVTLECATCHTATLNADGRRSGSFAPVKFESSCRSCHTLQFDAHIQAEAPHGKVEDDAAFVTKSITDFAAAHPEVVSGGDSQLAAGGDAAREGADAASALDAGVDRESHRPRGYDPVAREVRAMPQGRGRRRGV
jgi:hypothetical protein